MFCAATRMSGRNSMLTARQRSSRSLHPLCPSSHCSKFSTGQRVSLVEYSVPEESRYANASIVELPTTTTLSFLGCRRHPEPLRLLRPWYSTWIVPLVRAWTCACRPLGRIDCRVGVCLRSRDLDWCPWCRLESGGRDRTGKSSREGRG
jgi:hypothetical protein